MRTTASRVTFEAAWALCAPVVEVVELERDADRAAVFADRAAFAEDRLPGRRPALAVAVDLQVRERPPAEPRSDHDGDPPLPGVFSERAAVPS